MHAGFPQIHPGFFQVLASNAQTNNQLAAMVAAGSGRVLSQIMAELVKGGLGVVFAGSQLFQQQDKGLEFIEKHIIFKEKGQLNVFAGKYLIRTRQPGDDLNVYFRFCPNPASVLNAHRQGALPQVGDFIFATALRETTADAYEKDPALVDLVIRFRDIPAILGLLGQPQVDVVGLLLQNTVQLTGNVGYLFKLGAIGKAVQSLLSPP